MLNTNNFPVNHLFNAPVNKFGINVFVSGAINDKRGSLQKQNGSICVGFNPQILINK